MHPSATSSSQADGTSRGSTTSDALPEWRAHPPQEHMFCSLCLSCHGCLSNFCSHQLDQHVPFQCLSFHFKEYRLYQGHFVAAFLGCDSLIHTSASSRALPPWGLVSLRARSFSPGNFELSQSPFLPCFLLLIGEPQTLNSSNLNFQSAAQTDKKVNLGQSGISQVCSM
jgi:hypothetical protein